MRAWVRPSPCIVSCVSSASISSALSERSVRCQQKKVPSPAALSDSRVSRSATWEESSAASHCSRVQPPPEPAGATGAITFVGARQRSARSCFSVRCSSAALYCGAVPGL